MRNGVALIFALMGSAGVPHVASHDVIGTVLGRLEAAGRDAEDYSNTLSAVTGGLNANQTPADLRKLVDGLMAATREMENRTKSLEGELQRSSEQVTELRGKLDNVQSIRVRDGVIAHGEPIDSLRACCLEGSHHVFGFSHVEE